MRVPPPTGPVDGRNVSSLFKQIIEGRSNAPGTVTLDANQANTTVIRDTVSSDAVVLLFPATANAAAEVAAGTCYVAQGDIANGQFVITHANNAQTDRTFYYLPIGG